MQSRLVVAWLFVAACSASESDRLHSEIAHCGDRGIFGDAATEGHRIATCDAAGMAECQTWIESVIGPTGVATCSYETGWCASADHIDYDTYSTALCGDDGSCDLGQACVRDAPGASPHCAEFCRDGLPPP